MVAEVMGRHVGWIALHSGMAAGAHAILIPEVKVSMDEICHWVKEVHDRGRSPLVVVAEGFIPEGFDEVLANKGTEKDAAAHPPATTACWQPVWVWAPSIWCTKRSGA